MSTAVTATYQSTMTVIEVNSGLPDVPNPGASVMHSAFNQSETLNASSSQPATVYAGFQQAMVSGAATIDLTNLPGTFGTVSFSGLKVRLYRFQNPASNANPITITPGGSNAYNLLGSGFSVTLQPGDECFGMTTGAPVVGSGAKTIAIAGTGTQALNVQLVGG